MAEGSTNTNTDYLDGFQYTNEKLDFFPTVEGYVKVTKDVSNTYFNYIFTYTDHLGNIRLKYTKHPKTGELTILEDTHYYPFGLTHQGYQPNHKIIGFDGPGGNVTIIPISTNVGDTYKYKYNGKELQDEMGLDWYVPIAIGNGARNYQADLGRWMNVDPLAERGPQYSLYAFSLNNPINFFDPDGRWPWPVQVRSFISTPTTGGGFFYGDGRGAFFTGTSRVYSSFTVDPSAGTVTQPVTQSDATIFFGAGLHLSPDVKVGEPRGSNDNISFSENTASFDFSHSGKDPITPGFLTPKLNVHADLSFSEDMENGILTITGSFSGDKFPSTEAFVTDQSDTNLFLDAKKEKGGLLNLVGDNKKSLFNVNMSIMFDQDGNFTGVKEGKTTYSVEDWNNKVQNEFGQ